MLNERTPIYYWNALDRTYDAEMNVVMQSEERRIYIKTWIKTFKVSVYVTFFCLLLGFPVAHLLANLVNYRCCLTCELETNCASK